MVQIGLVGGHTLSLRTILPFFGGEIAPCFKQLPSAGCFGGVAFLEEDLLCLFLFLAQIGDDWVSFFGPLLVLAPFLFLLYLFVDVTGDEVDALLRADEPIEESPGRRQIGVFP